MKYDIDINSVINLVKKYDVYAFDYIEYPHKSFWSNEFTDEDYRQALKNHFLNNKNSPTVLYVHIPFCEQRCFFCICHSEITKDYEKVKNYLNNSLFPEINLLHGLFKKDSISPDFQEIYIGGGTPTFLHEQDFERLLEKIQTIADMKNICQFTIEIDPRRITKEKLIYYHSKGVNKISIGVQDFDSEVQKAVNRIQPPEMIENLLTPDVRKYFDSINFDILCGLPNQTINSIRKTAERVVQMAPDRISFTYMHYAPKFAKHHLLMNQAEIPNAIEKRLLFHEAVQIFLNNGYVRTGYEHFAKPTDDVAKALEKKKVRYNSLGVTQGRCTDLIGIGRHSYSTIGNYYFQNIYEQANYEATVKSGKFPIYRGHKLNNDDLIRRDVIQNLRSYFRVDYTPIEHKYNITFSEYFKNELIKFDEFIKESVLEISDNAVSITELGKYFTIQVCRVFDKYVNK